jgi:hypothetical protein
MYRRIIMDCKNKAKNLKTINQLAGISINPTDIDNAEKRMRFYMGLMDTVLMDSDFRFLRRRKFSCVEDLILKHGIFFEFKQEKITSANPFETSLLLAMEGERGYCEGFVLPWKGGIPEPHAWVFDKTTNKILSSQPGLHYGIAFDPNFAINRFHETGIAGIFDSDDLGDISILDNGIPKGALLKW